MEWFVSPDLPLLRVTVDRQPPTLRVSLEGEVDLASVNLLDALTSVELDGVTEVVVNLDALEFSDLAGARALLALRASWLAGDRQVQLVDARPVVRRLFGLLGQSACLAASTVSRR